MIFPNDFRLKMIGTPSFGSPVWTLYEEIGEYFISIKASPTHYCIPTEFCEDINEYIAMEIALFDAENEWVQPRDDEFFRKFSRFDELQEKYQQGEIAVASYLDIDIIQSLYDYLYEYA